MMNEQLQTNKIENGDSSDLVEEAKPETGLELHMGSNVFRNINGVVKLQGKEQIFWEVAPDLQTLLLTMDLYDDNGIRVCHIRRNVVKSGGAGRFMVTVNSHGSARPDNVPSVTVSDRSNAQIVIEAFLVQGRKIRIATGSFYSHKGELVQISPHYCRIGAGRTLFGDVVESRGGNALID
jgi:hypothetical protein